MSFEAINWAMSQIVGKSSAKFVLVVMANLAGDESTCWPSCKHIAEVTGQDIKTVEAGIKRLRDEGHITDTGARKGATGQVIVYRLNTTKNGVVTPVAIPPKTVVFNAETPPELVALPEPNTPVFPANTPVFPVKDPRFSGETPPKTGDGTIMEPVKEPFRNQKRSQRATALDIPQPLLDDYLAVRKAKKAGPLTDTAIAGLCREAEKAGLTICEAVTACCELGWQGFNAGWYAERVAKKPAAGKTANSRETFAERDDRNAKERYERLTGRKHPDLLPQHLNIIEAEPIVRIAA